MKAVRAAAVFMFLSIATAVCLFPLPCYAQNQGMASRQDAETGIAVPADADTPVPVPAEPDTGMPAETFPVKDSKSAVEEPLKEKVSSAAANEPAADRSGAIIVTAAKLDMPLKESGASVTIISGGEIEKSNKSLVADLLQGVPGVVVEKSGGLVKVYIRGVRSGNVLVLIDGIRVNDPSTPGTMYDFTNLTTANIERIEVVRGPASAMYGSDAMGGVINIITKKGKGEPVASARFEAGSRYTFRENFSFAGAGDIASYSLSLSREDSRGIDQTAKKAGSKNGDRDRSNNTVFNSLFGFNLPCNITVKSSLHYTDGRQEIDDYAYTDDPDNAVTKRNIVTGLNLDQVICNWWNYRITLGYSSLVRKNDDRPDANDSTYTDSWFEGRSRSVELMNSFHMRDIDTFSIGVQYSDETASALSMWNEYDWVLMDYADKSYRYTDRRVYTTGVFARNHLSLLKRIFNTTGIRYDYHRTFGSHFCGQTAFSGILPVTETRLKTSLGSGFKAPGIDDLYNPKWGNVNLKPEESLCVDAGIEQPFFDEKVTIGSTCFYNRYKNRFGYRVTNYTTYEGYNDNIDKARSYGIETELALSPFDDVQVKGSYTWTNTRDLKKKKELPLLPRHQAALSIMVAFLEKGDATLCTTYIGLRNDTADKKMDGYCKIDISASWWIIPQLQVFGRIENMLDSDYESYRGYNEPGFSFFGGVKGVLR